LSSLSEPDVSTALGHTAMLVALVAKYLRVPLRYTPVPLASRSCMRDEVLALGRATASAASGAGLRVLRPDVAPWTMSAVALDAARSRSSGAPRGDAPAGAGRVAPSKGGAAPMAWQHVFPLYWQDVEPGWFRVALAMLQRDVQQLLHVAGVPAPFGPGSHMLASLRALFLAVFDTVHAAEDGGGDEGGGGGGAAA
jgi:hypothetical protein